MKKKIVITVELLPDVGEEDVNEYLDKLMNSIARSKTHFFYDVREGTRTRSSEIGAVVTPEWEYWNDIITPLAEK